ncbi:hypothetical protein [Streptomyces sp. sk2.1]|uniref:hypothetical protein n=1 Tax=Streptomyces sp. sk2.1 TaxID=2478959 RepID=UPI0011E6E594|nr:hypothetical protein [Streptomyces sp. sk2.1]TXS78663.1 hypothetical protein EAO76_09895 [Streptomyces sp. sk2.1]
MSLTLAVLAALTAGYGLGRYKPLHRASDWANWQHYGKRPTGTRYWAVYTVLSAENIVWLLTHPVKGWDAWRHRHDPPPPKSPPLRFRTDHTTKETR